MGPPGLPAHATSMMAVTVRASAPDVKRDIISSDDGVMIEPFPGGSMLPKTLGMGAILALAGCASIVHGSRQQVSISSTPSNARVTVNGQPQGATPVVVRLKRKDLHT